MGFIDWIKSVKGKWEELEKGKNGAVLYTILGIAAALLLQWSMGIIFSTSLPVVTVSSESMVPTMNVGDIVLLRGHATYAPGEIIVFRGWREEPIIHRIVAKLDSSGNAEKLPSFSLPDEQLEKFRVPAKTVYLTKGDNNNAYDQSSGNLPIGEESVYGSSFFVVPYLGLVKIWVCRAFGGNCTMGIVFVLGVILLYTYFRESRK